MIRLLLHRARSTDQGTAGVLLRPDGSRVCWTMELPWRENAPRVSCIPAASYVCRPRRSPHLGEVVEIVGVSGRSSVLLHQGNYAGDTSKGFRTDSLGCVMCGLQHGILRGQRAVFVAKPAVRKLLEETGRKPFTLEIREWTSSERSGPC